MFEKSDLSLATLLGDDGDFERTPVPTRRLVTFEAGAALYGVPIGDVAEIREPLPITPLPFGRVPAYVRGLISLRGTILPVADLAALMGYGATQALESKPLVIVKGPGWQVAWLVNMVQGLVRLPTATFQAPPIGVTRAEFCEAVTQLDGRLLIQLNTQKLVSGGQSALEQSKH